LGIKFIYDGITYVYYFKFNSTKITEEKLIKCGKKNVEREEILLRTEKGLSLNSTKHGFKKTTIDSTRQDTLFITKAYQDNDKYAKMIFTIINSYHAHTEYKNPLFIQNAFSDYSKSNYSLKLFMEDEDVKNKTIDFIKKYVDDTIINVTAPNSVSPSIVFVHKTFHSDGKISDKPILFDISEESQGTIKVFFLLADIYSCIKNKRCMFIDEFGCSLHPLITKEILKLFDNTDSKLIFISHDTNLLN
jgi:hypothetical protein